MTTAQRQRFRREWCVVGSVLLLVAVVAVWTLAREHEEGRVNEGARLQAQARVVDENLARQLQGVDTALKGIQNGLVHGDVTADGAAVTARLTSMTDAMPGVSTMILQDRHGLIVASSRPELLGKKFAERAYFRAPRDGGVPSVLYVTGPVKTVLGSYVMFVGHVVLDGQGAFAGVVSASLDPEYFKVIIGSVLYAPDMRTALFNSDGDLFLTLPAGDRLQAAGPVSLFDRFRIGRRRPLVFTDEPNGSGDKRITALHGIDAPDLRMDHPMLLALSRDLAVVEHLWRAKVLQLGSLFAALAVAVCVALAFDHRRRADVARVASLAADERTRAARALRDSEDQLRQVTDNMPALVAALDLDERFRFANRAFVDWLGLEPGSLIGRSLRDVWGDATYATFAPHVATALSGEPVVYEREMSTGDTSRQVEVTLIPQRGADGAMRGVYALITDISARFEADLQRVRSEERLSLSLEGSGQALFDWDIANDRMYLSAQGAAMRGLPAAATTQSGEELRADVHPDDVGRVLAQVAEVVRGRAALFRADFRLARVPEGWIWVRAQGRVFQRDADSRALRVAGTYADVSAEKEAEGQLRRLAEIDDLTGLPNRAVFNERLDEALARATHERPMALLFLDIDHFKTVNDTCGHEAGDEVLKVCAARMLAVVRKADTVARLAGDEFTIILEALHDPEDASIVAGKLVERLRVPVVLSPLSSPATSTSPLSLNVTVSIGVALGKPGERDAAALLRRADAALYEAKRRGRDGYAGEERVGPATNFPAGQGDAATRIGGSAAPPATLDLGPSRI